MDEKKDAPHGEGEAASEHQRADSASVGLSHDEMRRRIIKAALAAAPVLITLHCRSVLALGVDPPPPPPPGSGGSGTGAGSGVKCDTKILVDCKAI